jgi:hypothetical protein
METPRTIVIFNTWRQEVHFMDPEGGEVREPYFSPIGAQPEGLRRAATLLAGMAVRLGEGSHTREAVAESMEEGLTFHSTSQHFRMLREIMPDDLLTINTKNPEAHVMLSNIAVAGALPTMQDEDVRNQTKARMGKLKGQERLALLEAAEAEKTDLTAYSHALVRFGQQDALLLLESPEEILYARTLSTLDGIGGETALSSADLVQRVWGAMPISERQLLGNPAATSLWSKQKGQPTIGDRIDGMISGVRSQTAFLQSPILIEATGYRTPRYNVSAIDLEVTLKDEEHDQALYEDIPRLTISPVGRGGRCAIKAQTLNEATITVEDSVRAQFEQALNLMNERLSHRDAIALLDTIMTAEGKRALWVLVQTRRLPETDAATAEGRIHQAARISLGQNTYHVALEARRGAQGRHNYRRRSGGRLPNDSKA